ncbi:hypothetical protein BS50DRAFT_442440, partial [Corynespora cassiicola Philippines]
FCFLCDGWICNVPDWDQHYQEHVGINNIPVQCDPITLQKVCQQQPGYAPLNIYRTGSATQTSVSQYM